MRFSAPRREGNAAEPGFKDDDGLGIHPALARKYKKHLTPAGGLPVQSGTPTPRSPTDELADALESGEGAPPLGELGGLDKDDDGAPTIQLSPSLVDEGAGETDEPVHLKSRAGKTRPLSGAGQADIASEPSEEASPSVALGAVPATPDPQLPNIPGYQLISVVGKGAMGCVYRAVRESSQEPAAVKILAKELAARADFVARFEREAAALKAVDHPGVVSILDRGSYEQHHYLAMPFVEGESLRRVLAQGPLQPIRALGFARQIAQALGAAHAKKVIHRDLKPENILVQRVPVEEGAPPAEKLILVDFGLAGMGEDDPHPNLTKSRMTMGTVNYMAPEQRTDAKRVGPAADVYAAGVILYELLTGDLPLGRFKMPTARPGLAHLPKKVDECVGRALDRDPEQRYVTCLEMDGDLAAIEDELEAQVARDTVVGRPGRPDLEEAPTEVASAKPGGLDSTHGSVARSAESEGASEVAGVVSRTRGPQWVTAPPWVKRPLLVWGSLALLVGAAIGVWTAPGDDEGPDDDTPDVIAFGLAFEPGRAGWTAEGGKLRWERPSDAEDGGGTILARGTTSEREPTLRATVTLPDEPFTYAGVVLTRGSVTPGFAVLGDRTCAAVTLDDGEPQLKKMACAVPRTGAIEVQLECTAGEKVRCYGRVGSGPALPLPLPKAEVGAGPWQARLVCGGSACTFERAELR